MPFLRRGAQAAAATEAAPEEEEPVQAGKLQEKEQGEDEDEDEDASDPSQPQRGGWRRRGLFGGRQQQQQQQQAEGADSDEGRNAGIEAIKPADRADVEEDERSSGVTSNTSSTTSSAIDDPGTPRRRWGLFRGRQQQDDNAQVDARDDDREGQVDDESRADSKVSQGESQAQAQNENENDQEPVTPRRGWGRRMFRGRQGADGPDQESQDGEDGDESMGPSIPRLEGSDENESTDDDTAAESGEQPGLESSPRQRRGWFRGRQQNTGEGSSGEDTPPVDHTPDASKDGEVDTKVDEIADKANEPDEAVPASPRRRGWFGRNRGQQQSEEDEDELAETSDEGKAKIALESNPPPFDSKDDDSTGDSAEDRSLGAKNPQAQKGRSSHELTPPNRSQQASSDDSFTRSETSQGKKSLDESSASSLEEINAGHDSPHQSKNVDTSDDGRDEEDYSQSSSEAEQSASNMSEDLSERSGQQQMWLKELQQLDHESESHLEDKPDEEKSSSPKSAQRRAEVADDDDSVYSSESDASEGPSYTRALRSYENSSEDDAKPVTRTARASLFKENHKDEDSSDKNSFASSDSKSGSDRSVDARKIERATAAPPSKYINGSGSDNEIDDDSEKSDKGSSSDEEDNVLISSSKAQTEAPSKALKNGRSEDADDASLGEDDLDQDNVSVDNDVSSESDDIVDSEKESENVPEPPPQRRGWFFRNRQQQNEVNEQFNVEEESTEQLASTPEAPEKEDEEEVAEQPAQRRGWRLFGGRQQQLQNAGSSGDEEASSDDKPEVVNATESQALSDIDAASNDDAASKNDPESASDIETDSDGGVTEQVAPRAGWGSRLFRGRQQQEDQDNEPEEDPAAHVQSVRPVRAGWGSRFGLGRQQALDDEAEKDSSDKKADPAGNSALDILRMKKENGQKVDEDLLYELELFERDRLGEPLSDDEMLELDLFERINNGEELDEEELDDLADLKKRRLEMIMDEEELRDLLERRNRGHNVDEYRVHELSLFKRNREKNDLNEDELFELEMFEKMKDGIELTDDELEELDMLKEERFENGTPDYSDLNFPERDEKKIKNSAAALESMPRQSRKKPRRKYDKTQDLSEFDPDDIKEIEDKAAVMAMASDLGWVYIKEAIEAEAERKKQAQDQWGKRGKIGENMAGEESLSSIWENQPDAADNSSVSSSISAAISRRLSQWGNNSSGVLDTASVASSKKSMSPQAAGDQPRNPLVRWVRRVFTRA